MYQVKYVGKDHLNAGQFGVCSYTNKEILIRNDLPACVKKCLLSHERQHKKDFERLGGVRNIFWLEIKANAASALKHPLGFVVCVVLSIFSVDRWKFYIQRFQQGK